VKKLTLCVAFAALTALSGISTVFAQAPATAPKPPAAPVVAAAPAPAAPAAAPKAPANTSKAFAPKNAKSKECSKKADEQKLHGKARQKFRAECKKAA
jgi:hypothetical protein